MPLLVQVLVRIRTSRMTAVEAANRMGVSRQQIWNIENSIQGPPSVTTLERYARAVGAKVVVKRLPTLPR